jgi:flagellar basal-body rod protein FlgG
MRDFSPGSFQFTNKAFDMAINGEGFFKVLQPDGTVAYTRDGSFRVDFDGRLVTSDGYFMEPQVIIPRDRMPDSEAITPDGRIYVSLSDLTNAQLVGQIQTARFVNPAGLAAVGRNLYVATESSGDAIEGNPDSQGLGKLEHKYLEASNVAVVDEMVAMIITQRAYELNSRAAQVSDIMLSQANNLLSLSI